MNVPLTLTSQLRPRTQGLLSTKFDQRVQAFVQAEKVAREQAAAEATIASRRSFIYKRVVTPARAGRSGTGGRMMSYVVWKPAVGGRVALDEETLRRSAPHWIIQEIGTGERAIAHRAGVANPQGRPRKGADYVRTVKSQKGRWIKSGIVFSSNGRYSPAGSATGEQTALASQVTGAPWRAPRIRIEKEIEGQHFVRDGGREGFRHYRLSVLAAARRAFDKG